MMIPFWNKDFFSWVADSMPRYAICKICWAKVLQCEIHECETAKLKPDFYKVENPMGMGNV